MKIPKLVSDNKLKNQFFHRKIGVQNENIQPSKLRYSGPHNETVKSVIFYPNEIQNFNFKIVKSPSQRGHFHRAISPVLFVAQFFGVMPVSKIMNDNPAHLRWTWRSFQTIYSIFILIIVTIYAILTISWTYAHDFDFDKIVSLIFYISIVFSLICFQILAKKWPKLMNEWSEIESILPPVGKKKYYQRLSFKVKLIAIVVISLSMVEHLLSILADLSGMCRNTDSDRLKDFFVLQLAQVFYFTDYTLWKAIIAKSINIISTFIWSYIDLFLMIMSTGLSDAFRQINDYMFAHKGLSMPDNFWTENRTIYRKLCELCDKVDNAISLLTLISFSNDLFFICIQLLRSLNSMPTVVHAIYFWFSLIFLISRTLAVSLYAANVNDESRRPIIVFRSVPKDSWSVEVKRFCDEVANDVIALSGMKFFYITRKLVLSVAGTIVTYELVLIQFHKQDPIVEQEC